jgi:hypothetical protein
VNNKWTVERGRRHDTSYCLLRWYPALCYNSKTLFYKLLLSEFLRVNKRLKWSLGESSKQHRAKWSLPASLMIYDQHFNFANPKEKKGKICATFKTNEMKKKCQKKLYFILFFRFQFRWFFLMFFARLDFILRLTHITHNFIWDSFFFDLIQATCKISILTEISARIKLRQKKVSNQT